MFDSGMNDELLSKEQTVKKSKLTYEFLPGVPVFHF